MWEADEKDAREEERNPPGRCRSTSLLGLGRANPSSNVPPSYIVVKAQRLVAEESERHWRLSDGWAFGEAEQSSPREVQGLENRALRTMCAISFPPIKHMELCGNVRENGKSSTFAQCCEVSPTPLRKQEDALSSMFLRGSWNVRQSNEQAAP